MSTTLPLHDLQVWLTKRGEPDSGIDYQSATGTRPARAVLYGYDATFVTDHFHGEGARELAAALLDVLQPRTAQCCACGKTGLSTAEGDGGTECQLADGRWTCSPACYDRATGANWPSAEPGTLVARLRTEALNAEAGQPASLRRSNLLREAADELADLRQSFDLRWGADMRAIKRWQAAHPGNDLTWPDHADLCVWLLGELDAGAHGQLRRAVLREARNAVVEMAESLDTTDTTARNALGVAAAAIECLAEPQPRIEAITEVDAALAADATGLEAFINEMMAPGEPVDLAAPAHRDNAHAAEFPDPPGAWDYQP